MPVIKVDTEFRFWLQLRLKLK